MNTSSPEAADRVLNGKCLCGPVKYTINDEFKYALNCHCSNCRRATGSAYKPFAGIECNKLSIAKGKEALIIFGVENAHVVRCSIELRLNQSCRSDEIWAMIDEILPLARNISPLWSIVNRD